MSHLRDLFVVSVAVTIVLTTFNLGLVFRLEQLTGPLRRRGLICLVGGVNVVVMPLFAWVTTDLLPLESPERVGVALAATGAGGALAIKAIQISHSGDLALALVLVLILELLNLISMPLWTLAIMGEPSVGAVRLVLNLVGVVLLPLAVGLVLKVRTRHLADAGLVAALVTMITVVSVAMFLRVQYVSRARTLLEEPATG